MPTGRGIKNSPEAVVLAVNPYPTLRGVWTNSGRNAKTEYMPMPKRKATRLLVHTAGTRIIFMSTTGSLTLSSTTTQTTSSTSPSAPRASVLVANQPHVGASETANSNATSHADNNNAAEMEMRPGERSGDSGT